MGNEVEKIILGEFCDINWSQYEITLSFPRQELMLCSKITIFLFSGQSASYSLENSQSCKEASENLASVLSGHTITLQIDSNSLELYVNETRKRILISVFPKNYSMVAELRGQHNSKTFYDTIP